MARSWKYILYSLWFYYLIFASIFLFSRGFLLRRDALTEKAKCKLPVGICRNISEKNICILNGKSSPCYDDVVGEPEVVVPSAVPTAKKVILMVVDALKYEFIMYNESLNESQSRAYQNKIPVVHELLKRKPHHTRVYKFIADPPTTTMQRLKGITTGSLPTFIDVGSNFATSEINEDNIIDQLVGLNLSIVFMGDDTWTALYPRRFLREFSYPSFNVWDLDTVDNGVMFHLIPEILKKDWKLLIAHVLGVDHCGHKYGPYHPEMSRKLKEVNANIRKVIDVMDEDTVLFVLGDHGMTSTGDHGGDSVDEVTAGLFVYSSTTLFPKDIVEESDTVSQVDIVPTLSLILGIPIPFSNLGQLTVGSIPYKGGDEPAWKYILMALWANANQVNHYLSLYSQKSSQLPPEKLQIIREAYERLSEHVEQVSTAQEFQKISKGIKEYLLRARNMCAEVWVQFDSLLMISGLCFMLLFVFCLLFIVDGVPLDKIQQVMGSNCSLLAFVFGLALPLCCCFILHIFHAVENIDIAICSMTCCLSLFFIIAVIIVDRRISINLMIAKIKVNDYISMSTRVILFISLIGQFSNSYVIEESTVLSFCLTSFSVIVLYFSSSAKDMIKQRYDKNRALYTGTPFKMTAMLLAILFCVVIRVSHYYWRCREEQKGCNASEWVKSASFTDPSHYGLHSFYTLIYLALLVTVFRMWLRSSGNLVGFSVNVSIVRYVPTVVAICMSAFWILQGLPKNTKYSLTPWQIHMWPCVIFFLLGVSVVRLYINPLSVYRLPKTKLSMEGVYGQDSIIPHLFSQIRESLDRRNRGAQVFNSLKDCVPVVYGLATVYSAAVIIFSLFTLLLINLVLGNHLAPSAALMFMASVLALTLQAMLQHDRILLPNQLFSVPWVSVVWWCLLSSYFFYATGHHPTFPSIQWDAAFVGGSTVHHIVPALLVALNTFASQLWFSVTLPLVLIFPFTLVVMFPKKDDGSELNKRGELILYEKEQLFHHCMFILCSKYVLLHGLRVFSCMLAAAVHCRHLMVWKIFAPKLIFESLSLFMTMVGTLMGYILVLRVTQTLKVMMRTLE